MTRVLAIDPGVARCGWALFEDAQLIACGWDKPRDLSVGFSQIVGAPLWHAVLGDDHVWVEVPQVYRNGKGDPNDLINVAFSAGLAVPLYATNVHEVRPREWKGQTPKALHNKWVLATLTLAESALIPDLPARDLHNVIDAIGLGLYAVRRPLKAAAVPARRKRS